MVQGDLAQGGLEKQDLEKQKAATRLRRRLFGP
jgi:hypothetical protein